MLGPGTLRVLAGVLALLALGTVVRGVMYLRRRDEEARWHWRSVWTWWGLFLVLAGTLLLGRIAVAVVMGVVSLLLLRETLRLGPLGGLLPDFAVAAAAAAATVALYLWAWLDWTSLFLRVAPVLAGLLLLGEVTWRLGARPAFAGARATVLAFLLAVVGPAFVVAAASFPPPASHPRTELGWLVLLLVLTPLNDSAQAWWGRWLGSTPLAPELSPAKTWEGFLGGVATTALTAVVVAPMLTDWGRLAPPAARSTGVPPWLWSAGLGLVVALAGTAGDLAASGLKRRAGVDDSGDVLPGHGGVLDRFDSLAAAAPAFVWLTSLLWLRIP